MLTDESRSHRPLLALALSVALHLGLAPAEVAAGDEAEFSGGIAGCRALLEKGRWEEARSGILELLEDHGEQGYVLADRIRLAEDLKLCTFEMQYRAPEPKDLISGELLYYGEHTGKIKVRYTSSTFQDFLRVEPASKGAPTVFLHPVRFRGPYTITMKGVAVAMVCLEQSEGYSFHVMETGYLNPRMRGKVELARIDARGKEVIETYRPARPPTGAKVEVSRTEIRAQAGRTLKARKRDGLWGGFGVILGALTTQREVLVEGEADPSWLNGLVANHRTEALRAFEKEYRPETVVPAWLLREPATVATEEGVGFLGAFARLVGVLPRNEAERELAAMPEDVKKLRDSAWEAYDRREFSLAMKSLGEACAAAPGVLALRSSHVEMIQKVSGRAAALAEAAKVLELFPERAEAYSMVVRLLLLEGVWQEAEAHLGRAAGAGVRSPELDQLETIVGKASHGPRWQKRFTHASRYYVVHSDIDEKTCREAGAILDEAYYYYSYRLKRVSDIENARFQVYVFSSTEAYKKYAENIGSRGEGSLGMYSSLLKQLLISSHLSAEQLARTIRHEGFHQYLDRVVESPPRWFNEGLAEYYEAAVTTAGRWEMGRVADVHLAQLRAKGLVPLRILFSESVGEFMANAQQRYAQSWAVIHFLRHSSREREELFEGILQSLIAHPDPEVALEKALGGLAPEILDIDLRRHVNGLIRGR